MWKKIKIIAFYFQVQKDELESHIERATKSHLNLVCGELRDTQEKLKKKIKHSDRLEEKVDEIQHQHQNNVDILQQQYQRRVDILQEQLEEKVKTCQTKLDRKISMERNCIIIFLVCLVLGLMPLTVHLTKPDDSLHEKNLGMVKKDLEDRFQKKLEEKVSVIQSLHEKNVGMVKKDLEDRFHKKLEENVSVIQSLHEKNVGMVKKDLEDRFHKKLEEKVSVIQSLHEKNLGMVKKDLEDRFQKKLEEKVSVIQSLYEKNVGMVKKDLEDRFQKKLEEKVGVIQSLHEKTVGMVKKDLEDRFHKKLEEKVSVIQSLHEKNVGMVKKDLEDKVDSLNTDLSNKLLISEVDTEKSRSFVWKITSFENKLRQAKSNWNRYVESVPFYAYGSKLMLRLYPNGFSEGENTHLSIFIVVMKGEYDAILPWGLSKSVIFTLFDQQDKSNQLQNVVMKFRADPKDEVFKKPVEGEPRVGRGFRRFVSHDDLRTRRFVVNDTLFIKVQVDSPKP